MGEAGVVAGGASPRRLSARGALLLALSGITLALAAAAVAQVSWVNGPEEWEWTWRPVGLAWGPALLAALAAGLLAALPFLRGAGRFFLPGAIFLGAVLTFALTAAQPGGLERVLGSLASRNSFGYVWDAALATETAALLADHPAASAGLNQHSRTHPPGPLLLVRALDRLLGEERQAVEGRWLTAARTAIDREISRARDRRRPYPERPPLPGTVVVLAALLPLAGALAAWPLASLARSWGLPPAAVSFATALWLLLPARTLFTPSLDQALPLLLAGAAALAAGKGLHRAAFSGLLLFAACFLTWGCLAAVPFVLLTAAAAPGSKGPSLRLGSWRFGLAAPAAAGAAFAAPWAFLYATAGFHPLSALSSALSLHRQIAVDTRSYSLWLTWNPYDVALLAGPLVAGLALAAFKGWRGERSALPLVGFWALLLALWLSGSVRGEIGRIWLMWMPFACVFAGSAAAPPAEEGEGGRGERAVALTTQALLLFGLAASMIFVS